MISFSSAAKVIRVLWKRNTPEPDFAFTAAAITDKNGVPRVYVDPVSGLVVTPGSIPAVQVLSGDGAITIKQGTVFITKGSAVAGTLAAPVAGLPTAGGDDGKRLLIESTTAFAHVITTPANKINGADDTATFGTAVSNSIELVAYNGVWYVANTAKGVTLTEV